jgi:hypothetical protein
MSPKWVVLLLIFGPLSTCVTLPRRKVPMLPHGRNTPCSGLARLDLATARRLRPRWGLWGLGEIHVT